VWYGVCCSIKCLSEVGGSLSSMDTRGWEDKDGEDWESLRDVVFGWSSMIDEKPSRIVWPFFQSK
jgi:hypothetical protein